MSLGESIWEKDESQRKKYGLIEVEEIVQLENGYMGTRIVKKYIDKDGNGKPVEHAPAKSQQTLANADNSSGHQEQKQAAGNGSGVRGPEAPNK